MTTHELQVARVMVQYAMSRAHTVRSRKRDQIGASALEWAIISAILVGAAILIGTVVTKVVRDRKVDIEKGS